MKSNRSFKVERRRLPPLSFSTQSLVAPWVMGVVNTTPDSFYAASRVPPNSGLTTDMAQLIAEGPDWLDVGGESTRPGATPVDAATEISRVVPLIQAVRAAHPTLSISVDTQKAAVARAALQAGAICVNDVSAFQADPEMIEVVAQAGCGVILMHMQGTPETMQKAPRYEDVVGEIGLFFEERLRVAERAGITREKIILDPGIGFGKTLAHNQQILHNVKRFTEYGCPVLIGTSRKMWIGRLLAGEQTEPLPPEERLEGSIAAALWALSQGVQGFRVHDVQATRRAITIWRHVAGTNPS